MKTVGAIIAILGTLSFIGGLIGSSSFPFSGIVFILLGIYLFSKGEDREKRQELKIKSNLEKEKAIKGTISLKYSEEKISKDMKKYYEVTFENVGRKEIANVVLSGINYEVDLKISQRQTIEHFSNKGFNIEKIRFSDGSFIEG